MYLKEGVACSGCRKTIKSELKTCDDCRERGKITRKQCKGSLSCENNIFKLEYCDSHYNEYLELENNLLKEVRNLDSQSDERLTPEYLGGMFDGDGAIVITKIQGGYQMFIQMYQCVTNILELIVDKYGGTIHVGTKGGEGNQRQQYYYKINGGFCYDLLKDLERGCIIKYHQVKTCLEFLPLINKIGMNDKKEELSQKNRQLNARQLKVDKPYDKITHNYIAGLFDSDGGLWIQKRSGSLRTAYYCMQITQKNDHGILEKIYEFLGDFGSVRSDRWVIDSNAKMINLVETWIPLTVVKQNQLLFFRKFIKSRIEYSRKKVPEEEMEMREEMVQLIHAEKHTSISPTDVDYFKNKELRNNNITAEVKKDIKKKIKLTFRKKYDSDREPINTGSKNPNFGKNLSLEHRANLSISGQGKRCKLSKSNFQKIREYLNQGGKTKKAIAQEFDCDRNLITRISQGELHREEIQDLSPEKLEEYKENIVKENLRKNDQKKKNGNSQIDINMQNSINKRKVKDIHTLINIMLLGYKINPKTHKLYTVKLVSDYYKEHVDGADKINEQAVKNLWCKKSKLYEPEFNATIISYARYLEIFNISRDHSNPQIHLQNVPEIKEIDHIT